MPHAGSAGARIHYDVSGDGEPLLLVMGYGLSAEGWAPLLPLLQGLRVIRYDNRGTGESDAPGPDLSVDLMADDALAVLDAAGVQRAHVVGMSMGGMIALSLALRHPQRVATLVLGCTTPSPLRFFPDDPGGVLDLYRGTALMATDPEAGLDVLLPAVFSEAFLHDNPSVRNLARSVTGSSHLAPGAADQMMRAMGDMTLGQSFDVVDRLGELRMPVLVQHGSADRVIPVAAGRYLAEHIAGARYQEFEGAGHIYSLERALEAVGTVLEFVREHPGGVQTEGDRALLND